MTSRRRSIRDSACLEAGNCSARVRPPATSADRLASNVASRRRVPPRSVLARTTPAHTMPIQVSVARATARLKASPLGPPTAPSSLPAIIAAVKPDMAAA